MNVLLLLNFLYTKFELKFTKTFNLIIFHSLISTCEFTSEFLYFELKFCYQMLFLLIDKQTIYMITGSW